MDHPRLPELRESKPQTRLLLSCCSSAFEGWALGAALGAAPGCREERQPVRAPNVGTQTIAKIIGGSLFFSELPNLVMFSLALPHSSQHINSGLLVQC